MQVTFPRVLLVDLLVGFVWGSIGWVVYTLVGWLVGLGLKLACFGLVFGGSCFGYRWLALLR